MRIEFDTGPSGQGAVFRDPEQVITAYVAGDVAAALAAVDVARGAGKWVAGFATYELGYALEDRLKGRMPQERRLPLMCFGVFDACDEGPGDRVDGQDGATLGAFTPRWDKADYGRAFDAVHGLIGAGDIYQANLTFPMDADFSGSPRALYDLMARRQTVGHGVMVEVEGLPTLLSRSPELFFRTHVSGVSGGVIETRPMKGTMPRGDTPQDDARLRAFLRSDAKNRAENLMIVDLLRNDISRVAELGSVHVPELFHVETYATLHQMTSLVRARLRSDVGLGDIFNALFPCGSITGAPKVRAMEVLNDLEPTARDIYCGTIGWAAPDGRAEFNVAIRTLMVEDGRATLNVGGGVVWDSTPASEYEEALWKARFAAPLTTEPA